LFLIKSIGVNGFSLKRRMVNVDPFVTVCARVDCNREPSGSFPSTIGEKIDIVQWSPDIARFVCNALSPAEIARVIIDEDNNITSFVEKPADPPQIPGKPGRCLASMGIYIFNAKGIFEKLMADAQSDDSSHDFGKDIIPASIGEVRCIAHPFSKSCRMNPAFPDQPYWRDVGTLTAFWEANIDLSRLEPKLDLYDESWPIRTMHYQRPAAKFNHNYEGRRGLALNSVVSAGCIVSGGSVNQSILFNNVRVNSYAQVNESVILPGCDIGRHCRLNRVVVDMHCQLPENTVIGEDPEFDAQRFYRNDDGIVLVTAGMIAKIVPGAS